MQVGPRKKGSRASGAQLELETIDPATLKRPRFNGFRNVGRPADLPHFDGEPEPAEGANRPRLAKQLQRVFDVMIDGAPRTLEQVAEAAGCSVPSASARLRDFRKARIMGPHVCIVRRTKLADGLYAYSLHNAEAARCAFSTEDYKRRHGAA